MANRTFDNVRIQLKRDTATNWEKNNPKLLAGEEILVDTGSGELRKKIGDGTKTYSQLPFTDEKLRTLISTKVDKVAGKGLSTNDLTDELLETINSFKENIYEHPEYNDQTTEGLYKITVEDGHVKTTKAVAKADITALGIPAQDTTYNPATSTVNGLMSKEDKAKLDGIQEKAEENQNAFSNIKVGNAIVAADAKTDTVELVAGTNVQISAATDKITINATDTTYGLASASKEGLMSSSHFNKLEGIDDGANKYVHPSSHAASMITEDTTHRFVTDAEKATWNAKASTAVATESANGLMSSSDKSKLNDIEDGANKYVHPTYTAKSSGLYKITVDGTGHVSATTAVQKSDITGLGIPAQDTTYKPGTGLELSSDNTFNHTNSITAGTAKGDNNKTLAFGGTFTIPSVTYDAQGHITKAETTTMTMPAAPVTYTHPTSHPATMITEDTTHRFVTDDQITAWNAKADQSALTSHINDNKSNPHAVTKAQVGLSNVTNDAQVKRFEMGVAGGVATLDNNGTIPSSQLPSYVDDVIEGYYYNSKFHKDSAHTQVITGESGKIYVDLSDSKTYRWSGTQYVIISESLALGETASTAYAGDKGKANAAAIVTINEKLSTIDDNANYYVHPATHAATMITEDASHRFVTDTQITSWNAKASTALASSTANGLMSKEDKAKLDGIATNANNYSHPTYTGKSSGLYKITVDGTGHVSEATAAAKADITALGIPAQDTNTTYDLAASVSDSNGNVKLNLTAGGSGSGVDSVSIKGSGATTVTTNDSGEIIISSTDNNTVYTHPTYERSNTTSTATPDHGDEFTVIDGISTNTSGHVTSVNTKTVTLPDISALIDRIAELERLAKLAVYYG